MPARNDRAHLRAAVTSVLDQVVDAIGQSTKRTDAKIMVKI